MIAKRLALPLLCALLLNACSSDGGSSSGPAGADASTGPSDAASGGPGAFGAACGPGNTCAEGLICSEGGDVPGICTRTCLEKGDDSCEKLAYHAYCSGGYCAKPCLNPMDPCPPGSSCHPVVVQCSPPVDRGKWTCMTEGGVCTCKRDPNGTTDASCPFADGDGDTCCLLGGPVDLYPTWETCFCLSSGDCGSHAGELGWIVGAPLDSCPFGKNTIF